MKTIRSPIFVDYVHLLLLGAMWGSTFIAIEIAITNLSTLQVSLFRIMLAFIFLLPIVFYKKYKIPNDKKTWFYICITAVLNNAIPFSLISWSQQHISSGTAAIILACGPFTTLIIGHLFTRDEKITMIKFLGIIFGFLGVFIIFFQDVIIRNDLSLLAKYAVFLASCCYVISGFMIRKLSKISAVVCSSCMFFASSCMLAPLVLSQPLPNLYNLGNSLYAIIFLAIIPTASASLLRINLIQKVGMHFISQVSYLIPIFALIWGFLFFQELPETSTWFAFSLIILGLSMSKIKRIKNLKKIKIKIIIFSRDTFKAFRNTNI